VLAARLLRPSSLIDAPENPGSLVGDGMGNSTVRSTRLLPDGTPLHNRLLAALPTADYARIQKHLHMNTGVNGRTLQAHGAPVTEVYFPNGGVFSVTNEMRDGALVEVATVGIEGMLGITTGGTADHEQVRANPRTEAEEARTDRMRVLRNHSHTLSAARVVIAAIAGDLRRGGPSPRVSADPSVTGRKHWQPATGSASGLRMFSVRSYEIDDALDVEGFGVRAMRT
jgi:hypothetical protein